MKVTSNIERITPAMAKRMLAASPKNFRTLNGKNVKKMCESMRMGWHLNGSTIVINPDGEVLDGQHRLNACIETGITFETIVVRNVVDDRGIDEGQPRTLAQWLAHDDVPNAALAAAVTTAIISYEDGGWGLVHSRSQPHARDVYINFYREHKNRIDDASSLCKKHMLIPSSTVAAMCFVGTRDHFTVPSESINARYFVDRLRTGTDLSSEDAILHLRKVALQHRDKSKHDIPLNKLRAYTVLAWNKTLVGETCKALRWAAAGPRKMEFPTIMSATE